MLIDRDEAGTLRVDEEGFRALVSAVRGAAAPEAAAALQGVEGLADALEAVTEPAVTLGLVVAGESSLLSHRTWVDREVAVVLAELRQGVSQLLVVPPGHLAAALVRLTRLRPRRTGERTGRPFPSTRLAELVAPDAAVRSAALADAGSRWAWQLTVGWAGEDRRLSAVDGDDGPFLADPDHGALLPTTNTVLYRLFTTVLPPAALAAAG